MPDRKRSHDATHRPEPMRSRVLAAAERLLRNGAAEFSMRELAAEAGVSFATPFNQFGGKPAIMQALSAQRLDAMAERFAQSRPEGDATDRVFAAIDIAASVMLEEPAVNRAVIGTLGAAGGDAGQAYSRSRALWALAMGEGDGLEPATATLAQTILPDQLALAFRGALSFWTAGEIADAGLARRARDAAAALLLGFAERGRRPALLAMLGTPRPFR